MPNPTLLIKEISERASQRNFEELQDYFRAQSQLLDFQLVDLTFTEAGTQKAAHTLKFAPLDVLVTRLSDYTTTAPVLTWNYGSFDSQYVSLTVDKACRVRAFVGTYKNGR